MTPLGWGTAIVSVVLYGVGWWLGYPEPAMLGAAGLLAVVFASLFTLPRTKLRVAREIAPTRVQRDEPAVGVLHVTNLGRAAVRGVTARDTTGATSVAVSVPRLRAGRTRTVNYTLPTGRRGELRVGPLRLERADPLRLAHRVREYGDSRTLLVRPRTVPLPVLPSGRAHHLEGPTSDRSPAGTATFHTLREYAIGDELRHIHWRSSARTGTLMVRRLVDAGLPTTTVFLDTRADRWPDPDAFELAVDAAASVAVGAASANFPVRVLTGDGPLAEPPSDRETLLDRLTTVKPSGTTNAMDAVRRVRAGGALVVVTGGETDLGAIATVRGRFDRVVVLRIRPSGVVPAPPGVRLLDVTDLDALQSGWKGVAG